PLLTPLPLHDALPISQRAFTSVDLPTFGRPATATKPDFTRGGPRRRAAARSACARRASRPRGGTRRARTATRTATGGSSASGSRSEEHTSELQSPYDL